MPVYLLHGFRWPREGFTGIRVHAILYNLEDCSVEYIQNENSQADILRSFRNLFPDIMKELEGHGRTLEFIEQHDPEDLTGPHAVSQPHAFVADRVVVMAAGPNAPGTSASQLGQTVQSPTSSKSKPSVLSIHKSLPSHSPANPTALSINVEDVIADGPGLTTQAWEALADLRDKIAEGEKIGWWVVYNGDPERAYDDEDEGAVEGEEEDDDESVTTWEAIQERRPATAGNIRSPSYGRKMPMPPSPATRVGARQALPATRIKTSLLASSSLSSAGPSVSVATALPRNIGKEPEGLTALPQRDKQNETFPEPAKLKEAAKSASLRKRLFGKRA